MTDERPTSLVAISDLLGLGAATKSLLRTLTVGVGASLEPWQRRRLNQADLQNAKDWMVLADDKSGAPSELTANLGDRARLRFGFDQTRFQRNREQIARCAVDEASGIDGNAHSETQIDDEWIDLYWSLAEKVSSEDCRDYGLVLQSIKRSRTFHIRRVFFIF